MATNFIDIYRDALKDSAKKADGFVEALRESIVRDRERAKNIDLQQAAERFGDATYDTDTGIYTYTYRPGDSFSDVINNLGLRTNAGLWGPNGDVAYYTKQLNDQGIYGNIPAGTTIKLRHRNPAAPVFRENIEASLRLPNRLR